MSRYNKLPFARGKSAFQNNSTDLTITSLAHLEGQKVYLPNAAAATPEVRRNGTDLVAVVVRCVDAVLYPGEALWWKTGYHGTRVTKTAATDNGEICGFVDDHANATNGIQVNDLFYMIVEGPTLVKTLSGGTAHTGSNLVEGKLIVASGTVGKVHAHAAAADADGADADTVWNIAGRVITTTALGTDTLVNVKIPT